MFIYICQTSTHFQLTKKPNNWNLEKVHLVVCGYFLVVWGRLMVVCGRLLVVCGCLLVVSDHLSVFVVVCGGLWSLPVLVSTIYDPKLYAHNNYILSTSSVFKQYFYDWLVENIF